MTSIANSRLPGFLEDPNEAIERGRKQVQAATRRFFRQQSMTQPKWIKLSNSLYQGEVQHLHSSQIGGLASGKMKDPSPKCLLVIGQLNQAVAEKRFPPSLRELWENLVPMTDVDGNILGPEQFFLAAAGQIDLGLDPAYEIPPEREDDVSRAVGAYLRRRLIEQGIDFIVALPELRLKAATAEALLMGRCVDGDSLLSDLQNLASLVGETDADLWNVCSDALYS
jgi:hypothetical protein